MGDEFFERETSTLIAKKVQCLSHMPVLAAPGTMKLQLLPRNVVRVDGHFACIPVVAQHEKLGAVAAHFDGFRNHLG